MNTLFLNTALVAFSIACTVEGTTPRINNTPDAQAASGGSSGSGGKGGSASLAGSGGSSSIGGASGAGTAAGSGGSGGADMDASLDSTDADQGDGFDGRVLLVFCDGGSTYSGTSLVLDGSSSYGTLLRPVQDDLTLEAWIKTTTSRSGGAFWEGVPLFHADVQGGNNDYGASILNDTFAFGMGLGPALSDVTLQSTSTVTTGEWVHVAATRKMSTGEVQIIVNGILENTQTYAQVSSLTASPNLTIGGNLIDSRFFVGQIDEVRIWNIVRTPADILSTMYKKLAGTEAGLVAYYKFDDTGATTATDSSPSHVDLELKGQSARMASSAPLCQP